ncbi:MAG: hypothetical protein H7177_14680 [Rhizobacter sp.]|nr:hypothetical protein [Bacteriovorax sp.]
MKKLISFFLLFLCLNNFQRAHAADTGLSATSLKFKVFKMAVSTSPLCTNLITVLDNGTSAVETDFLQNPNLGSGVVANGTYPCLVIEMEDIFTFRPSANSTSGHCNTGVDSTLDICRTTNGGQSKLIDGTNVTCGVPGTADRIAIYISTATVGKNGDAFFPPTSIGDTTHGTPLTTALTNTGTSSGKLVVNTAGGICDKALAGCDGAGGGTTCAIDQIDFSFVKL